MDVISAHGGMGGLGNVLDAQKVAVEQNVQPVEPAAEKLGLGAGEHDSKIRKLAGALTGVGGKIDVSV